VHCIDALRYVLGADVVSISTLAQKDGISGRVEAVASLQMEMSGGIYANVTASARGLYRTVVEVTGSDGALVAENGLTVDRPVELTVRRGGELLETVTVEMAMAIRACWIVLREPSAARGAFPRPGWMRSAICGRWMRRMRAGGAAGGRPSSSGGDLAYGCG